MPSILSIFLTSCSIRHTSRFADSLYYSHPNRNNLLGLKQMLEIYNLKTQGVKYENKLSAELSFPWILHITETFVIGTDLNNDTITYLYEGKKIQKSVTEFCNIWSGVALLPTSCFKKALEPDYTIHKKKEHTTVFEQPALGFSSNNHMDITINQSLLTNKPSLGDWLLL